MNTEEDEFRRIEAEAKRRAARDEYDDTQVYAKPCIGKDPQCPCQDGDACHYKDCGDTKALLVPVAQPEQRKPLTATSILNMMPSSIPAEYDGPLMEFARAIEQALKERNT